MHLEPHSSTMPGDYRARTQRVKTGFHCPRGMSLETPSNRTCVGRVAAEETGSRAQGQKSGALPGGGLLLHLHLVQGSYRFTFHEQEEALMPLGNEKTAFCWLLLLNVVIQCFALETKTLVSYSLRMRAHLVPLRLQKEFASTC